jgi:hypothetical protein
MKEYILGVLLMAMLVGCSQVEPIACTADAKICPDGSGVGRDPENDCEFFPCPERQEDLEDLERVYVSTDRDECALILYQCIPGSTPFSDDIGCGCQAEDPRNYVSQDLGDCSRIRYTCAEGKKPFTDDRGCGCEMDWNLAPENGSDGAAGTRWNETAADDPYWDDTSGNEGGLTE